MNPYFYVAKATRGGESLLSLCCGIGLELAKLKTNDITAVDIAPQYLEKIKEAYPEVKTVCADALEYVKSQPDKSVDVISIIDGIEHMEKKAGLELIPEMKRVARKEILLYTPEGHNETGFVRNEPHNAWGIEGADHFQRHLSGWTADELRGLGFNCLLRVGDISQHGEPFLASMYSWRSKSV